DNAAAALRHEYAILQSLAADSVGGGLVHLVELNETAGGPALVLEDAGSSTLKDRRMPLSIGVALDIAGTLAKILARVHARGVIHRDINPANIVLDSSGHPTLIDFDLATTSPEKMSSLPLELADSLPYIAPEQTGRMSRVVDARSDLYSLGV